MLNLSFVRAIFAICFSVGLVGIAFCALATRDWKIFILGVLYGIANVIIFLVK